MADNDLPQEVADELFGMEKYRVDEREHRFSTPGQKLFIELVSEDGREKFCLDLYRGKRNVIKVSLQNRARQTVPLRRLDVRP